MLLSEKELSLHLSTKSELEVALLESDEEEEDCCCKCSKCCKCKCCKLPKCCEVPKFSPVKRLNWCFLWLITIACALSGMQIGGAMFNDAPLMVVIET